MMGPRLDRLSDGTLRFTEIAPWFYSVLLEVPELLDSDQPEAVSQRLYPEPSDDEEIRESWDKYVRPDLFALVASAREIVLQDLGNIGRIELPPPSEDEEDPMEVLGGLALWSLEIPVGHVQAWISALNVARLTLSTRFAVEDGDMEEKDDQEDGGSEEDPPEFDMRTFAITRIHLLGWIQQMMIEEENPPPSDADAPWMPKDDPEDDQDG